MPVVQYTPQHFDALKRFSAQLNPTGLLHRPFVDHYYAAGDWCKLNMLMAPDGSVVAVMGVDRMRFQSSAGEMTLGFASNFYTLESGAGGILFMYWMRTCPAGLVFGSSDAMDRILRRQNWARFDVPAFYLNPPYRTAPGEAWWRVLAKAVLRNLRRKRISLYNLRLPSDARADINVEEEREIIEDMLPRQSPYAFRFAPTLDYLRWRYKPGLSFVFYRLFRIVAGGATVGYVIINESSEQITVAQCDGEDPVSLAYGVLLAVLHVGREDRTPRTVLLTCCHAEMRKIFERFGFHARHQGINFVAGNLRGPIDVPADTSKWLINFDWGDNGMVAPFPDQAAASKPSL